VRRLLGLGHLSDFVPRASARTFRLILAAACLITPRSPAIGGEPAQPPSSEGLSATEIDERFRRLEGMVEELARQNQTLMEENRKLAAEIRSRSRAPTDPKVAKTQSPPVEGGLPIDAGTSSDLPEAIVGEEPWPFEAPPSDAPAPFRSFEPEAREFAELLDSGAAPSMPGEPPEIRRSRFFIGDYDNGFVLVEPTDKQRTPFELKFNLTTEVRYLGFARSRRSWTDSAGVVRPISNRSFFSLNRSSFTFGGFAFSPRLQYNLTILTTTTTNQTIPLGYVSYVFSDAFVLGGGNNKIPGTREWLESYRYQMGADRTMATTYFRPGFSPGVWIRGEPRPGFFYYGGVYNGLYLAGPLTNRSSADMSYTANIWWEPLGAFGPGYADQENHERLVLRTGGALSHQRIHREPSLAGGVTNPENTVLRISDGTQIFEPGALGPGATLGAANVTLLAYDLSLKRRGFSLSGEYFGRWIYGMTAMSGTIPSDHTQIFDTGGLIQGSYSPIPRRLDLFGRASMVAGPFGQGSEYGGGVNWYVFGNRNIRGNFEVKRVLHSPADNPLSGYMAGDFGTMYFLQLMADF